MALPRKLPTASNRITVVHFQVMMFCSTMSSLQDCCDCLLGNVLDHRFHPGLLRRLLRLRIIGALHWTTEKHVGGQHGDVWWALSRHSKSLDQYQSWGPYVSCNNVSKDDAFFSRSCRPLTIFNCLYHLHVSIHWMFFLSLLFRNFDRTWRPWTIWRLGWWRIWFYLPSNGPMWSSQRCLPYLRWSAPPDHSEFCGFWGGLMGGWSIIEVRHER